MPSKTVLVLAAASCGVPFLLSSLTRAGQLDIPSPAATPSAFGTGVTVLPNGNFVVTDPEYDAPGPVSDVGAVYLYDGSTLDIISTLTGSTADDKVGSGGVNLLANGNFLVVSPDWNNGGAADAGAVTWGSQAAGVGGTVSEVNSLVGTSSGDRIGEFAVTALPNGNYVVISRQWDHGTAADAGAVTWGNGASGVTGPVSATNSLVGSSAGDQVGGFLLTVLPNDNYVVTSQLWDSTTAADVGAVTWGSGTSGVTGAVSAANSLVGDSASDRIGISGITVLTNGNYVVRSPRFDHAGSSDIGAVTWGSGTTGVTGVVSPGNSLVGSNPDDQVGIDGVTPLANGNYVVACRLWDNGAATDAGAVTWCSGTTGATGPLDVGNRTLVGTTADDQVGGGFGSVVALTNGNYVVACRLWDNGTATDAGAVTWGDGTSGADGPVSDANSLVGVSANDRVGNFGGAALSNGNYVVTSPDWDDSTTVDAGAVTWGNGTTGVTGVVSAANSLVGVSAEDRIGSGGVAALTNGNYVVRSSQWDAGGVVDAGAVTWGNGTTGVTGMVSAANSLVGSTTNDFVGSAGITPLSSGNYVVRSPNWNDGAATAAGAVTWGNGVTGVTGTVSAANSLVGSSANDSIGAFGVVTLTNGNYVVVSPNWNNGPETFAGAVTWADGTTGITGVVSADNSLVGTKMNDGVGQGGGGFGVMALPNGNYVVNSQRWSNGPAQFAGAVTWGSGTSGVKGAVSAANSLVGSSAFDQVGQQMITVEADSSYIVTTPNWDNGAVSDAGAVSLGDGTTGTSGPISAANSVFGTIASGGWSMVFAADSSNNRIIVGYPAGNRVSLFGEGIVGEPEITVEQPVGVDLLDGGLVSLVAPVPVGAEELLTFTIRNTGSEDLTGLGISITGDDATLFTVTAGPTAPVSGPLGSTTFTVRFAPTTGGTKSALLQIASNDADENPFDINLSGLALSFAADSDGDGLNDLSESKMAALGFDWEVSQPALVAALFDNANGAGLFTTSQVQAMNVDTPLLQIDPATGLFTLTIGVKKATNLVDFSPFPMSESQTTINGAGKLEFEFSAPDDAAFFRLESN